MVGFTYMREVGLLGSKTCCLGSSRTITGCQHAHAAPTHIKLTAALSPPPWLQVVRVPLPSLFANVDVRAAGLPPQLSAYAAGALFALAASPCSTPVLASILAYASTQVLAGKRGSVLVQQACRSAALGMS